VSGGSVVVRDWPEATTQAGDALRDLLTRMGCRVERVSEGLRVTGPEGGHRSLLGLEADLHDVGELAPAIAALCALASTPSHLTGIAHIRGHETDRLAALAKELSALGAGVDEHPDGLTIRPAPLRGGVFHTYADHRMAHAGVIIAAAVPGVLVENVGTTSKTFPDFAGFWSALF
jgi:3-phosphoshikimate 1-carboxyvinyltransferase